MSQLIHIAWLIVLSCGVARADSLSHPKDCPALIAQLGERVFVEQMRAEYGYNRFPQAFEEDGRILAEQILQKIPSLEARPLARIIARAIENGYQHGRYYGTGPGYVELAVEESDTAIVVYVINPTYFYLPPVLMNRDFRPGQWADVEPEDLDRSRGGHGVGVTQMFDSLARLPGSVSMRWDQIEDRARVGTSGLSVLFTLTLTKPSLTRLRNVP